MLQKSVRVLSEPRQHAVLLVSDLLRRCYTVGDPNTVACEALEPFFGRADDL